MRVTVNLRTRPTPARMHDIRKVGSFGPLERAIRPSEVLHQRA